MKNFNVDAILEAMLKMSDRVSDMVIRDGVNVYPREIEDVLHLDRKSVV